MYLGTKFIKESCKIPEYLACRAAIRFKTLASFLPEDMRKYIELDHKTFADAFNKDEDDVDDSNFIRFEGNVWVFTVGPNTFATLSKLKMQDVTTWGIQLVEGTPIMLNCCEDLDHGHHDYLASFHLGNAELLIKYQEVMRGEDQERKDRVKDCLQKLELISNDESITHEGTPFHCYGRAFKSTDYDEDEWTVRLYHSIENNVPDSVKIIPSYQYKTRVISLVQKLSASTISPFFLKGVPDLVLIKKTTTSGELSGIHVYDEEPNLIEIKPGHLTMPRQPGIAIPHAFAQMMGGLHFVAACKVMRCIVKGNVPAKVLCKGLLIKRKDKITLFKLEADINKTNVCGIVKIDYNDLLNSDYSSLAYLCGALQRLWCD